MGYFRNHNSHLTPLGWLLAILTTPDGWRRFRVSWTCSWVMAKRQSADEPRGTSIYSRLSMQPLMLQPHIKLNDISWLYLQKPAEIQKYLASFLFFFIKWPTIYIKNVKELFIKRNTVKTIKIFLLQPTMAASGQQLMLHAMAPRYCFGK